MFKKVSTLLLIAVFMVAAVGFAGVNKERKYKVAGESVVMSSEIAATSSKLAKTKPVVVPVTAGPAEGIEIGTGDYDYGWNSGSPRHIAVYDNGNKVHMTYMTRDLTKASPDNRRGQVYVFWDAAAPTTLVTTLPRPLATGGTGFGAVDVIPAGAGAGIAVMVYHTPNFFAIDGSPGGAAFTESAMPTAVVGEGGLDPEIAVSKDGNTLWYSDSYGRADYLVAKSTDFGGSWFGQDTLFSHYTPGFVATGALDNPVITASNGDAYMVTTLAGNGSIAPLGSAHPDTADQIGYYKTTNGGTSWTWTVLGRDGDALVVAPGDTVYVLFENFSGSDAVVDANNNLHVVANGYTQKVINDSTASNRFYTLYWKTGQTGWKIISDPAHGAYPEYDSAYYAYSGNAFGHAYPTIAAGGNSVFAIWSQTRFTDGKMDTTGGFVDYDMWYSYSNDNGATWVPVTMLANSGGGLFTTAADELVISGTNATAYFTYIKDGTRGSGVFGESTANLEPNIFRTITFSTITSVGNEVVNPASFELAQNFPNPFNPTTSIRYTIGKADNVSLKVYNMLGQEVASVVNQFQTAGSYTVNFDASKLASGMYLYKIQSGSFSDVKKMMLLK
ncbi:MAG: T9SS type A sorting domain-containing protein [Bacteroidota bacterium]